MKKNSVTCFSQKSKYSVVKVSYLKVEVFKLIQFFLLITTCLVKANLIELFAAGFLPDVLVDNLGVEEG